MAGKPKETKIWEWGEISSLEESTGLEALLGGKNTSN
jgi:hypothetical protein